MAPDVAANIRKNGAKYDRKQLASFQQKAGLTGDGVYGPLSQSALKHFGATAPKALSKGPLTTYTPPA
jgi:peptidoglycan hydrolase-like protein with peptidoglycan-binding domain